jgi:uncharacterized membrane protein YeaQ/YmgE (transglycosylase-associated protein family)
MSLIITIIVGAIAGWLADLAFKSFSLSLLYQILLGIAGALVGNWLLEGELNTMLGLPSIVSRIIEAFIGASVILLGVLIYRKYAKKA